MINLLFIYLIQGGVTAATVKASVKYFPLRQGINTHPEVRKMFLEAHENSDSLSKWVELAKSLNNQGEVVVKEYVANFVHCRLFSGAYDNRHLEQICCIDDHHSGTKAAVWCDSTHKQVIVRKIVVRP